MKKLIARIDGELFEELHLEVGHEYVIGRKGDCDLVLEKLQGVSRKHFQILESGSGWKVVKLSRKGDLLLNGESVNEIELDSHSQFQVGPYTFFFHDESSLQEEKEAPEDFAEGSRELDDSEETRMISRKEWVGYLKIQEDVQRSFEISGKETCVGRDPECDIQLSDILVSRYHFKIHKKGSDHYITDLGSANGTSVNGVTLRKKTPLKLKSNDSIEIMTLKMTFELHDKQFDQNLHLLPSGHEEGKIMVSPEELEAMSQPPIILSGGGSSDGGVINLNEKKGGKNFLRHTLIVGAILLISSAIYLEYFKPPSQKVEAKKPSELSPFERLSEEHQLSVKQLYITARNMLETERYSECLDQIRELHDILPKYEDSQEMSLHCDQQKKAFEKAEHIKARTAKAEREKKRADANVRSCTEKFSEFRTAYEVKMCLDEALDLFPEYQDALDLISRMEDIVEQKEIEEQRKEKRKALQSKGRRKFAHAKKLHKQKKLKAASRAYKVFLSVSYPGLGKEVKEAKRGIAAVEKIYRDNLNEKIDVCVSLAKEKKYMESYESCHEVLKIERQNQKALGQIQAIKTELEIKMKPIYQRAVVNEDLGNIELAKKAWHRIIKESIPAENFYKKSARKLKVYGITVQ